jgi:MFS family permease
MTAALVLGPYALGFLVVSLVVPRLVARFGGWVIVTGALVLAIGMAVLAWQAAIGYAHLHAVDLAPALVVVGLGQGLVMIPLLGVILAQIPVDRAGVASGVLATTQQATLALGVAGLGTLFFSYAGGPAGGPGWRDGTVGVFAAQAVLAVLVAVAGYLGVVRRAAGG